MTSPISRIGSQRAVTRDAGSDGHEHVARKLDGETQHAQAPKNQKVMDVAKMYERQFLGEMFKAMRSTVSETDKPSMAQNIYNSQRDEQYIDAWSEQGGVGFSHIIYDQIMERYFGQTQNGQTLRKQGMIPLTNREIANVSEVKNGVATPIVPKASPTTEAITATAAAILKSAAQASGPMDSTSSSPKATSAQQTSVSSLARTFEEAEPMPAPTPPKADTRSLEERVAAGEHFPVTATSREPNVKTSNVVGNGNIQTSPPPPAPPLSQTALQIEVRPSPTGQPAKIQAPWDAVVVRSTKLDGTRTAVTLEHGQGLRSTLVFDGVLSTNATVGQKIPRGEAIATLNQDAKSFLWNLAPQSAPQSQTE
jgi:Rod binding domain-containing protein